MLYLGIALLVIAAALSTLGMAARIRSIQIERRQAFRDEFFACAMVLIKDKRSPDLIGEVTEFLAREIADKQLTWFALWGLVSGAINRKYDNAEVQSIEEAASLPPDLVKVFRHLSKAFVLAITFNNFLVGTVFRRLFLWPATLHDGPCDDGDTGKELDSERARVVVSEFVDRGRILSPQLRPQHA